MQEAMSIFMPRERLIVIIGLPPEGFAFLGSVSDFVHGLSVEQSSIDHDHLHLLSILNIDQWIFRKYNKIGQLTYFQ